MGFSRLEERFSWKPCKENTTNYKLLTLLANELISVHQT